MKYDIDIADYWEKDIVEIDDRAEYARVTPIGQHQIRVVSLIPIEESEEEGDE